MVMASYNRVILVGNLTRDPELRYLPSGTAVAEFGMAINRRYRTREGEDREEVCFVDISTMGRSAEVCAQYLKKGRLVMVEGRLKLDQWENKEGQRRSKLRVVGERVQFLGGRGEGDAPPSGPPRPGSESRSGPESRPGPKSQPVDDLQSDDIPF